MAELNSKAVDYLVSRINKLEAENESLKRELREAEEDYTALNQRRSKEIETVKEAFKITKTCYLVDQSVMTLNSIVYREKSPAVFEFIVKLFRLKEED